MTTAGRPRGSGLARSGWITTAVGGVITVLAGAVGTILTVGGFESVVDVEEQGTSFRGRIELTLEADETLRLYKHAGRIAPECTVTGEAGPVAYEDWPAPSSLPDQVAFAEFTVPADGVYTVTCLEHLEVIVSEPRSWGAWIAAVLGIVVSVIGGGVGLLIAGVGAILWISGLLTRGDRS